MNVFMLNKIRKMGLEGYVDNTFSKKARRSNIILILFFLLGGVGLAALGIFATESGGGAFFLVLLGIGALIFGIKLCFKGTKVDTSGYKDELTRRHGDYKAVLREIESRIFSEPVHLLDAGFYSVTGWLIVLCSTKGAHFIRKTEIAAIIGTNNGTEIIWDNGKLFIAFFNSGSFSWDQAFYVLAHENPFLLSNGDLVVNAAGIPMVIDNLAEDTNRPQLIAAQFQENVKIRLTGQWYGGIVLSEDASCEGDDFGDDISTGSNEE